eukprot:397760-Prymnesium_polylepis.1
MALPNASQSLADGVALLRGVCFSRSHYWPGDAAIFRCDRLTPCHTEKAEQECTAQPATLRSELLKEATGLKAAATDPRVSALDRQPRVHTVRHAALVSLYGNIGHDLYFEGGIIDIFSQLRVRPLHLDAVFVVGRDA